MRGPATTADQRDTPPVPFVPHANLFDEAALVAAIERWAAVESPTHHREGVNAMMTLAGDELAALGASVERHAGRNGLGDALIARFDAELDAPGILVLAHLDTVHAVGSVASAMPIRRIGDALYGPGVFDMKGGALLAIHALAALQAADRPPRLPVTFLFVPDEEIGSPTSRDTIEAEASRHRFVLVPEPAQEAGDLITGRWAFQRFVVRARGRPAHAGARLAAGRSAIREIAEQIPAIEGLTDASRRVMVSVGVIHGGTFVNVVPVDCTAEVLAVTADDADFTRIRDGLLQLVPSHPDIDLHIDPGPVRPSWEPTEDGLMLYRLARRCANQIGFDPGAGVVGGGSDGNFTGALGITTLDGLGPRGDGFHTPEEHVSIPSLVPRARLLGALLASLQ